MVVAQNSFKMVTHTKPGTAILYIPQLAVIATVAWCCYQPAFASAEDQVDGGPSTYMGGRNSIPAQLGELADAEKAPFLERLKSAYGVSITADYATIFQSVDNVLSGEKNARHRIWDVGLGRARNSTISGWLVLPRMT